MRTKSTFILLVVLFSQCVMAQAVTRLIGPLALYHIAAGYSYADSAGVDSVLMEDEFHIGELAIPVQSYDNAHFTFQAEIDSCVTWHANKLFGILQPPTEHGVNNQPADTVLYDPFALADYPGMIQAAARISRLSALYGPPCGVIMDDWNGDTTLTHELYDAAHGKYVDANGTVHGESFSTTPDNKLYTVLYTTDAHPEVLPYMDGLYYSYFRGQNCCYYNLDNDISLLRANFPHKEIMIAIFLKNSALGWTDPESIHFMLAHALDRYDDGDIDQVNLFAGNFLIKENVSIGRWDSMALPHWLDSLYYPYLGEGVGRVYDCHSGNTLQGAFVRVYCEGRVSGDTLMRSRQMSDATGSYQCGLWAGNRNTDSTRYWLIAEKAGYVTDTIGFWIRRGDTTVIPDIALCPGITGHTDNMLIYPEPTTGRFTVEVPAGRAIDGSLDIYDMLGRKVYAAQQMESLTQVDLSDRSDGIYVAAISVKGSEISRKRVLLVRH